MSTRLPNPRRVKIHRSYTVEEVALLFGVHKQTVRNWIKAGLSTLNEKRPMLILGRNLFDFLQNKRKKNKRPCKPWEMYCLRCRSPKKPVEGLIEFQVTTDVLGNLVGLCSDCGGIMNRRTSLAKLDVIGRHLDITMPQGMERLDESSQPRLNCDFNKGE